MRYYMICPNCGKGTIGRYATDNSLCGECSDNSSDTDKLSVDELQEQLNTAKKALTEISSSREYFSSGEIPKFLPTEDAQIAIDALTAIGGDGE